MSALARKDPRKLLSLEDKLPTIKDMFYRKGMQLCIDGFDPQYIRDVLNAGARCIAELSLSSAFFTSERIKLTS